MDQRSKIKDSLCYNYYMQFPVPQFTDVEDKIIGSLTIKQFGIIFAAGIFIFLGYSASKSILALVFMFLLFGLPALGLAFAPFNGRPIYNSIPKLLKFLLAPKVLIFHKEVNSAKTTQTMSDAKISQSPVAAAPAQNSQANLREVQELLRKTASEESDIAGRLH